MTEVEHYGICTKILISFILVIVKTAELTSIKYQFYIYIYIIIYSIIIVYVNIMVFIVKTAVLLSIKLSKYQFL